MQALTATTTEDASRVRIAAGQMLVRALLACGVLSSLLYVAADITAAMRYAGYSYRSQTISELSAVGAPTRSLWIALGVPYGLLVIAFGVGVMMASATAGRRLKLAGALLVVVGLVALAAWPFAPMHQREGLAAGGGTAADTMHLALSGVDVVLALAIIALGAAAFGMRFRAYSIATVIVMLFFGTLVALDAPRVSNNQSTPWVGITERINVFSFMLWFAVLAVALLRRDEST